MRIPWLLLIVVALVVMREATACAEKGQSSETREFIASMSAEELDAYGDLMTELTCKNDSQPALCYCTMNWVEKNVGWLRFLDATPADMERWAEQMVREGSCDWE